MTDKSMEYPHAAYISVASKALGQINGSGGASNKFVAFTAKFVKSVIVKATTAGTSADVFSAIQISGTTTTTVTLGTIGSGVTAFTLFQPASGFTPGQWLTLARGDTYYVVKGTDATGTYIGELEEVIQPTANITL